jgi:hypothetical protein
MTFNLDPVNVVNTALCIVILILGYWGYQKGGDKIPLLIGIAFGIFGASHIVTLLGLGQLLMNFLIVIRVIAYLVVVFALWRVAAKRG